MRTAILILAVLLAGCDLFEAGGPADPSGAFETGRLEMWDMSLADGGFYSIFELSFSITVAEDGRLTANGSCHTERITVSSIGSSTFARLQHGATLTRDHNDDLTATGSLNNGQVSLRIPSSCAYGTFEGIFSNGDYRLRRTNGDHVWGTTGTPDQGPDAFEIVLMRVSDP